MTTTVQIQQNALMQGDAFPIPVYVKIDGSVATKENIDALRIGIGPFTAKWPNGTLDEQNGVWLFPLTQEQSYQLTPGLVDVQAQVRVGKYTVGTAVTKVAVGKSLLKGAWS